MECRAKYANVISSYAQSNTSVIIHRVSASIFDVFTLKVDTRVDHRLGQNQLFITT